MRSVSSSALLSVLGVSALSVGCGYAALCLGLFAAFLLLLMTYSE
jgi:ABC-type Co2+ transport system permease subunit